MAETRRAHLPTWAALLTGALIALLLVGLWVAWSRMQGVGRELEVRIAPPVPELPAPRLPDAPRLPNAPIPVPK